MENEKYFKFEKLMSQMMETNGYFYFDTHPYPLFKIAKIYSSYLVKHRMIIRLAFNSHDWPFSMILSNRYIEDSVELTPTILEKHLLDGGVDPEIARDICITWPAFISKVSGGSVTITVEIPLSEAGRFMK